MRPIVAATLVLVLIGGLAHAAPQPPPVCIEETVMDAGKTAPCSGLLVPTLTYAQCLTCRSDVAACETKRDGDAKICAADRLDDAKVAQAKLTASETKRAATEEALASCEAAHAPKPPEKPVEHWYSDRGFIFGLGLVLGVAATVAVVEAVR